MMRFPFNPGSATADEVLAMMANPATVVKQEVITLGTVATTITPLKGRYFTLISIQKDGATPPVWVSFTGNAVKDACFKFYGVVGFDVSHEIPISLIAEESDVPVCIIQFGVGQAS
jgi:hypothetical protein